MQTKWAKVLLAAVALVLMTMGCGGEEDLSGAPSVSDFEAERAALANREKPTGSTPRKPNATPGDDSAEASEETGYASSDRDYFYDPRNKRDPFRSIRFVDDGPEDKDFGPLGDFELGQLELQAVIWDATNPRALILDPGGRSYIIREGSAIGKNNGQVIHIGDNLVLVKETYEDFAGTRTTKDVELRIRLSQGG
jgi:type IV pilus assembly protein PilP